MEVKKVETSEEAKAKREIFREIVLQDMPTLVQALFNGLYKLDEASQASVLKEVGKACSRATRARRMKMGAEHPTGCDLDAVCGVIMRIERHDERIKAEITCKRDGDTIVVRDSICDFFDGCCCRFVLAGFIEPNVKLCRLCQVGFTEDHLEYLTGQRPIKIEVLESRTMGNRSCTGKYYFEPAK